MVSRLDAGERVWVGEDGSGEIVGFAWTGDSRDETGAGELAAALRVSYPSSTLWVLADNPRARRFYEREGWVPDGATKSDQFLGVEVTEVRYRL